MWRITLHYVRYDVIELNCALIANVKNINFFTFGSNIRYGKDIFRLQAMIHTRVTDIARQVKAYKLLFFLVNSIPDSKAHGANMGTTWVLSVPDVPHVGPMNLAIRDAAVLLGNKLHRKRTIE